MTQTLEPASVAAPRPELDWERDWNGRPRILPDPAWDDVTRTKWQAGRAGDDGSVPYTRVTTFAEALQDASALTRWKMRRVALGMGRRPDYVTAAAGLSVRDEDKQALDDLAEKALEAAGPNAADVGTALHAFTERIDRGEELGAVPEEYEATLAAYTGVVAHLRFVDFECRTVCDELEAAGTPDRVGFCDIPDPDGVVDELRIIDNKTGRVDYSAGKFSTQLAVYAHSTKYHPGTGARTSWQDAHGAPVSTRWGLVVHVPAGAGTAELLWIDLAHGWTGAQHCARVREWRAGAAADALLLPVFARPPRPATADGTCRGRKQDGTACGYRRKARAEGTAGQFCARHAGQARDLERWWAENPDADRDGGVEQAPSREPVILEQPPAPVVASPERQEAAADATVAAALARRDALAAERAPAWGPVADDPRERRDTAARRGVLSSLESLGVAPEQIADRFGRPVDQVATWRLTELVRHVILQQREMREELQRRDNEGDEAALHEDPCPWCAGTGCSVCQPERPVLTESSTDVAAQAFEHAQAAVVATEPPPARELAWDPNRPVHDAAGYLVGHQAAPPAGTYALDPATEVNGNPRPVSGLQIPAQAHLAAARAQTAILHQLQVAQSKSELELIWAQADLAGMWSPELAAAANERLAELARERPEAALLAALETAPDAGTLHRLFLQYGRSDLWTTAATAAAQARWEALQ
jgi:hypothetical protein